MGAGRGGFEYARLVCGAYATVMLMVKAEHRSVKRTTGPRASHSSHRQTEAAAGSKRKARRKFAKQLIGYTASGGARFWSGYGAFFVFDKVFGLHLWWAKQLANVLGLLVEFTLNRLFVFTGHKDRENIGQVSGKFLVITVINFLIDYWIILRLSKLGVSPYIGQFVSAGFFWAWNFVWYKFWVFTGSGSRSG